jgi:hypothetical protein
LGSAEERAQIESYVAELRRRTEDYRLPAAEARREVDGVMETKLTDILYRISRAEPLAGSLDWRGESRDQYHIESEWQDPRGGR